MKSKTLELIENRMKLLEQDEDMPVEEMPPEGGGDVTEQPVEDPAPEETIPLSSPSELRYIEDVVLAALMEPPSGEDRVNLENVLDLLKTPDNIERLQGGGTTAKDFYQSHILPIIRPAQQNQDVRDISDRMSQ